MSAKLYQPYASGDLPKDCCFRAKYEGRTWAPYLDVIIEHRGYQSRRLRALVDSGSAVSLFDASICESLDIQLTKGSPGPVNGLGSGKALEVYYHDVKVRVAGQLISTFVGFSKDLPETAILGRHGFFEHFVVTFDPTRGGLVVEKIKGQPSL